MSTTVFDQLPEVYDSLVDWPKRLAAEEPFYRRWFSSVQAASVLDAACGTGRHAAMFHGWGMRVQGADLSPMMIQRARDTFGQPPGLEWVVRGFDEEVEPGGLFDAAICVGNSLALAPDPSIVKRAVGRLMDAVRPGGIVIVQVLNLWHLPDGPCIWQKCMRKRLSQGEVLVLKGVHRCGGKGYVELVVVDPATGRLLAGETAEFLGLEADFLTDLFQQAGASRVEIFGGYQQQAFDRQESIDLVVVAKN